MTADEQVEADAIKAIDDMLAKRNAGNETAGYHAFVLMQQIWPQAKAALTAAIARPAEVEDALRAALKPFADYADPDKRLPEQFRITSGSHYARRQLTMGDCYAAAAALSTSRHAQGEDGLRADLDEPFRRYCDAMQPPHKD